MTVREIVEKLNLRVFSGAEGLDKEVTGGYVSDLLSDVMGFAKDVKGFEPEDDAREVSDEEGIPILGSSEQTFELAGKIYNLLNP